ncbi:uncharacterized protein HKW66_Vig0199560 [Vigna angularis]|uniref:Uncharacterized protein n=3 Tax=Phaseolus angularis TaxID=3914 RepID=A0A8T0KPC3_PHAAN|nr:uncharacterized protein LOC108325191 [Vigna angularis]XP_052731542.1 uncharacterized protein LOC108325191 [Vigna angularis]KAG2401008.1 uncharacterized protein HKW66_Vig0199560 [Vigna angularis]BAT93567.1 hypothetical protein VIGAN_08007900 [Vigna angularis var. angularis]
MMSQQQNRNRNLPAAPQSLLRQTGFGDGVKPFSLRQYVLASRHRNFFQNWPFHEKFLQLCLKHGLEEKEVLPPFGSQTSLTEPLKDSPNLMHSSSDDNDNNDEKEADSCKAEYDYHPQTTKNDCDYKVKEGNQQNCNISANLSQSAYTCNLPSSTHAHKISPLMPPPSKKVKDKCRRHKGRCKKRSMVDILAVARHTTLEEIHRMNKFYYPETVIEEYQQTVPYGNISMPELGSDGSCRKGWREDAYDGLANVDMAPKGPLLLKFKLNGCNVNGYCRT